ncbi:spry domain containing socs box protein [Anaeramoeba flamelloides]|uniref:Spry domain containing socs box protein n=1 Tax=Anaeramoeba flamelloides TaxID=1746091 RepID=A0AAV7ZRK7_9EUKA|nr:spry domain containing socs box protein [Anaeramoeba flamelloides]KAJ6232648.1 spry domain containing socs box protein [Anaeramoeba flamelloides]|eukprot:Anaeramoba_flamelloidesa1053596_268.p1 GENE.a1053596_268~~a1053596_268.p1  ORF type:complete len:169 (+),score=28.63 a1053596_268:24-509(+)
MSEADTWCTDEWDPKRITSTIVLSNDNKTAENKNGGWALVKGKLIMTQGIYRIRIKIDRHNSNNLMIGVCQKDFTGISYQSAQGWMYDSGSGGTKWHSGTSTNYSQRCNQNDIVTVVVDMDKKEVSFERNGKDLGVAYTGIASEVVLAVDFATTTDIITIL